MYCIGICIFVYIYIYKSTCVYVLCFIYPLYHLLHHPTPGQFGWIDIHGASTGFNGFDPYRKKAETHWFLDPVGTFLLGLVVFFFGGGGAIGGLFDIVFLVWHHLISEYLFCYCGVGLSPDQRSFFCSQRSPRSHEAGRAILVMRRRTTLMYRTIITRDDSDSTLGNQNYHDNHNTDC